MMFIYFICIHTYFSYGILDLSSVGLLDLTCWKMTLGPLRRDKDIIRIRIRFFTTKLFLFGSMECDFK